MNSEAMLAQGMAWKNGRRCLPKRIGEEESTLDHFGIGILKADRLKEQPGNDRTEIHARFGSEPDTSRWIVSADSVNCKGKQRCG